jgi:hypothetical protein
LGINRSDPPRPRAKLDPAALERRKTTAAICDGALQLARAVNEKGSTGNFRGAAPTRGLNFDHPGTEREQQLYVPKSLVWFRAKENRDLCEDRLV